MEYQINIGCFLVTLSQCPVTAHVYHSSRFSAGYISHFCRFRGRSLRRFSSTTKSFSIPYGLMIWPKNLRISMVFICPDSQFSSLRISLFVFLSTHGFHVTLMAQDSDQPVAIGNNRAWINRFLFLSCRGDPFRFLSGVRQEDYFLLFLWNYKVYLSLLQSISGDLVSDRFHY